MFKKWHGLAWAGMGWNGPAWAGMGWNGHFSVCLEGNFAHAKQKFVFFIKFLAEWTEMVKLCYDMVLKIKYRVFQFHFTYFKPLYLEEYLT